MFANKNINKNKCNLLRALSATCKDFAETTSVHGIKYMIQDDISLAEKILWVGIVILGCLGSGFMMILFWERYMSNPTRTSTYTTYAPNAAIPLPALTLCTINRLSQRKITNFIKKLEMTPEELEPVRRAVPQLMGFTHPGWKNYSLNELQVLHRVLERNDYNSVVSVMRKIATTCPEMLLKCKWKGKLVGCMDIFQETLTTDGLCCSFNHRNGGGGPKNYTDYFGPEMGLSVYLDPRLEETRYSVFRSTGIKMIFHKSTDYPGIGATHKFVAAGKASYMQIAGTRIMCSREVRLLSIDQRECIFPGDLTLRYFSEYTNPNCYTECTAFQLMEYCGCAPYFYWFTNRDKPICSVSKIPCLAEFSRIHYKNQSNCTCYSQCEGVSYDVLTSSMKTVTSDHLTKSFLQGINDTTDKILLTIFFGSDVQTIFRRDTITSTIYLLSSFGGVFSLFLGCSFLSCAEILYHLTLRIFVNAKILKEEKGRNKIKNINIGINKISNNQIGNDRIRNNKITNYKPNIVKAEGDKITNKKFSEEFFKFHRRELGKDLRKDEDVRIISGQHIFLN